MAGALADLFVGLLRTPPEDDGGETSIIEAAAKGDLDRVKAVISKHPEKVLGYWANNADLQKHDASA